MMSATEPILNNNSYRESTINSLNNGPVTVMPSLDVKPSRYLTETVPDNQRTELTPDSDMVAMDNMCGVGRFKPKWLQFFNNARAMFVLLALQGYIHGFITIGVTKINTSSFERRFQLSSSDVGWINSANDFSAATIGTILSYYASKRYKARWVSLGSVVAAIGSVCMCLPHFLTPEYEWGQNSDVVCLRNGSDSCTDDTHVDTSLKTYLYLLFFGHFLNGISGSTIMTIGMAYLDDSFPTSVSPVYTGVTHAAIYFGAVCGFILGGQALNLYVDFDTVSNDSFSLTPSDPRWVGAWWLCFLVAGVVRLVLAAMFAMYGSEIPRAAEDTSDSDSSANGPVIVGVDTTNIETKNNITNVTTNDPTIVDVYKINIDTANHSDIHIQCSPNGQPLEKYSDIKIQSTPNGHPLKLGVNGTVPTDTEHTAVADDRQEPTNCSVFRLLSTLLTLLKSPTFVCMNLSFSLTFFVLCAFSVFLAKVIQNQFVQTQATSALLAGSVIITGAVIGQFLGGFLVQRLKLETRGTILLATIMSVASVPLPLILLVSCDQAPLVGWNTGYSDSYLVESSGHPVWYDEPVFETQCNEGCGCRLDMYEPVCDENNARYFSPCFAGCLDTESIEDQVYSNCMCLEASLTSNTSHSNATVSARDCIYGCDRMIPVLAVLFVALLFMSATFIPIQTVILRIHPSNKAFSLGIMWLFARVLGAIPGPIILGHLIDVTCVVWGRNCDDSLASCWIYENEAMGRNICILFISVNLAATLMLVLALRFYRKYSKSKSNVADITHNTHL